MDYFGRPRYKTPSQKEIEESKKKYLQLLQEDSESLLLIILSLQEKYKISFQEALKILEINVSSRLSICSFDMPVISSQPPLSSEKIPDYPPENLD